MHNHALHMPYSRKALEDLAVALRIDSAYLWVDPACGSFSVKDAPTLAVQPTEVTVTNDQEQ